ncbi:MAG: trypsin-like peptidase domain-containing protein [Chloroflexi bacterium]|nr:trypsin-like peptidase domain-containing protein [Chloroflexota bacterium]
MDETRTGVRLASRLTISLLLVVLMAISGMTGAAVYGTLSDTASAAPALYNEEAIVALYERATTAVVEITVTQPVTGRFRSAVPQSGLGSGFLVDTEGHILTNYHVIQGASQIRVTFSDGRTLDAQIAGTSPADDLALVKVDPQALKGIVPLPLGDSSAAKPGQMAIALGSPFGLENSITVGVVSGVNRSRSSAAGRPIPGMIQTDASINPGNSGGPLLNSRGEVIGINTAIEASAGGATGVGFAVPVNTAKSVLDRLSADTVVKRPWLGISGVALSRDLAQQLGLNTSLGIYIATVAPGSPAEAAGLRGGGLDVSGGPGTGGDVIIAVDGRSVSTVEELASYFNTLQPGDTVALTVTRSGQTVYVSALLGEWPET